MEEVKIRKCNKEEEEEEKGCFFIIFDLHIGEYPPNVPPFD
jgi:hypothetical protein